MADNNETASAHVEDSFEDIDLDSMSESLAADLENAFENVELLKEDRDKIGDPDASVSYTHLRAHETDSYLVCRLLLEKKNKHTS